MFLLLKKQNRIVLVLCLLMLPGLSLAQQQDKPENSLRVMSYNVQQMGFPALLSDHFEEQRLIALASRIKQMDPKPDVIAFQEVFLPSAHAYLIEELSDIYPYFTGIGGEDCTDLVWDSSAKNCVQNWKKRITHNSGVFILSRWPIERKESLQFQSVRVSYTFDFMARKGAVYALINKAGFRFQLVATHLQADRESHDIRMSQLDEIENWLEDIVKVKDTPMLYAGDFNISSKVIAEYNEMIDKLDVRIEFCKPLLESVAPERNHYLSLIYGGEGSKTLDYIFLSNASDSLKTKNCMTALDFKSETEWYGYSILTGKVALKDISDHFPVVIEYEYDRDSVSNEIP